MHADTAAQLRRRWEELGNPPCKHPKVELESVSNRYLTGKHVCTTCGSIVILNIESDRFQSAHAPEEDKSDTEPNPHRQKD